MGREEGEVGMVVKGCECLGFVTAKVAIILEKQWRWWGKSDGGAFLFEDCIRNGGRGCVLGGFATGGGLNHGGIDGG